MKLINLQPTPTPEEERRAFMADVHEGFFRSPKSVPFRYLYDQKGSELFEAIMQLDAYYPTRVEGSILRSSASEITEAFDGERVWVVDLGSGNSLKTQTLLNALRSSGDRELTFLPIDISADFLMQAAEALQLRYRDCLRVVPLAGDFYQGLDWAFANRTNEQVVLTFPGSTIGNFEPNEALSFLRFVRDRMHPQDFLLLSTDMVKDEAVLRDAYDDREGITARFILNVLERMNRELGASFDLKHFHYRPTYSPKRQCMEMQIESALRQSVRIGDEVFDFNKGELILVERSHKFKRDSLDDLFSQAGMVLVRSWSDSSNYFRINLAQRRP